MKKALSPDINLPYIILVFVLTFILPFLLGVIEIYRGTVVGIGSIQLWGKWFIFSAVGLRLLIAGIKQVGDPGFTAREIFNIQDTATFPIVRELGFSNICIGLLGIVSLLMPGWRLPAAFVSGLYYAIAGFQHLLKKVTGINELFALVTDLLIFGFLLTYFIKMTR